MNKLIKELAKQAELVQYDSDSKMKNAEKFAELILTEVISTIYGSDISDKKQEKLVDELSYKFGFNE